MQLSPTRIAVLVAAVASALAEAPDASTQALLAAIERGDRAAIQQALQAGANPNAKDAEGAPALMVAALYADAAAMKMLLDKGADPNAANPAGGTALHWSTSDPAKANLLLDRGASPNPKSALGRTPLLAAAAVDGNSALVARLLKAGADPKAADQLTGIPAIYTGGGKAPVIVEAAKARDGAALRQLIAQGADIHVRDNNGATALTEAVALDNVENVRVLLAAGAKVETEVAMPKFRPLMIAAVRRNAVIARMLLKAGADVHAKDALGSTALMWAAYGAENSNAEVVRLLLEAGADPAVVNKKGESAMTWARWHGNTPAARMLESRMPESAASVRPAEAILVKDAPMGDVRRAIADVLPALQKTGPIAVKNGGCVSCHSTLFPAMTVNMAKERGFTVDTAVMENQVRAVNGILKPAVEVLLEGSDVVPQIPMSGATFLMGLAANQYPANRMTTALVHAIANRQLADGSWNGWALRPPMSGGDLRETAYAARALALYAPPGRKEEMNKRIAAARAWLLRAQAESPDEETVRLLGLHWTKASTAEIRRAGVRVLAAQQPDGGWRQMTSLASDAYATGEAMVALVESGVARPSDPAYQRGVAYLMRNRQADGTWRVATRAFPFQLISDSGFPHGRDQWISATATSWATMALLYATDPVALARR